MGRYSSARISNAPLLEASTSVARTGAEFAGQESIFNIAVSEVKATCRLGAGERAPRITSFDRPGFERPQQRPTDAAKPRIRRDVIQRDLSRVGDRTHRQDRATLDGYKHRSV